jgi:hypothetical protein
MTPGRLVLRAQTLSVIVGLVFYLWLADARAVEDGQVDVVLRNGKIYTADPARSIRQAVAIKGKTIVAVGDDVEVAPLIGAATTVVDLNGKLVLPDSSTPTSIRSSARQMGQNAASPTLRPPSKH